MASLGISPATYPKLPTSLGSVAHQASSSSHLALPTSFLRNPSIRANCSKIRSSASSTAATSLIEENPELLGLDNLRHFFNLNIGKWHGSFFQFDANGRLLQRINTKLSASSYGEDELISLIQTLYIEQPRAGTSVTGDDEEKNWAEYKIKEANIFTVDKYQQISLFTEAKAFALRYQTAGMLETVLRQGVLGEDDTEEESPKNLKLPSLKPSVVCENCLYSTETQTRARAFHIMDPRGALEMLLIFLENKTNSHPTLETSTEKTRRIEWFLGEWKGYSVTKRSGVYGATIDEAETVAVLRIDEEGNVDQEMRGASKVRNARTNVRWRGSVSGDVITFDGGYQITMLPGGMYMGCPCDIAKHVAETKSFHLEFCWVEPSAVKRHRLVRTFDAEGLAVSSTYFFETRD